jgi:acyl carrier protein
MSIEVDVERSVLSLVKSLMSSSGRNRKTINRDTSLRRDLGLDSIRLVALVVRFEETLGVDISKAGDIDFTKIQTVGDAIDVGQRLVIRCRTTPTQPDGRAVPS